MLSNAYICIESLLEKDKNRNCSEITSKQKLATTIAVRFNGEIQDCHTAVTSDGKRHTFRHFGTGSFLGIPTYLSSEFLVNIYTYTIERYKLDQYFWIVPKIFVNPNCRITTIWDINISKFIKNSLEYEKFQNDNLDVSETIYRSQYPEYCITVKDLSSEDNLKKKFEIIQNEYVPKRLKNRYGIDLKELSNEERLKITKPQDIEIAMLYSRKFINDIIIAKDNFLNKFETAIFEGTKELKLRHENADTYSEVITPNSEIKNVMQILNNIDFKGNIYFFMKKI